jgi:hypothetical protein
MKLPLFLQIGWRNSACIAGSVALLFFLLANFLPADVLAQMSSGTYKIPSDSINVGGLQSTGTLYNELDTIGEVGSGDSNSTTYRMSAGFLSTLNVYLSISAASDIAMTPSLSGLTGGTGNGSTTWTVTTDNAAGYTLSIKADTTPALKSGSNSFANYTTVGADPDYTWAMATADSEFGFSPEGTDLFSRFKDNGSACNTGALDTTDKCWDSVTTSDKTIAQRTSSNHPSGTSMTVKVRAESGTSHIQPVGTYTSTITATLLPL